MKTLQSLCPSGPDWTLDWSAIDQEYEWVRALRGCDQDPLWHAEGNVWVHTRMVLEELAGSTDWRALPDDDRLAVFSACLLHDVEKPSTTRTESDGRITARNHSKKGAIRARQILWRLGVPFSMRELVCNMVLHHQVPFFLTDRDDPERLASRISWTSRCDLLSLVTEADGRGRKCQDQGALLDNIELFRVFCAELNCLDRPRDFASDTHRVEYFQNANRQADSPAPNSHSCEVTLMSGLPGSGKDHWIRQNFPDHPAVCPDEVRRELGASPTGNQGAVIQSCRESARVHLRAGRDFVWNATNLSLTLRSQVLDLFRQYGARIRIVYVETDPTQWADRNRSRAEPIPTRSLERMLSRWQVPDPTEAHEVQYAVPEAI